MLDFLARRVFGAVATLLVVVSAVFFATRLSGNAMDYLLPPGVDPETQAAMVARFGLDQPLLVQFGNFLAGPVPGRHGTEPLRAPFGDRNLCRAPAQYAAAVCLCPGAVGGARAAAGHRRGAAAQERRRLRDHGRGLHRLCDTQFRPRHRDDPGVLVQPALAAQLGLDDAAAFPDAGDRAGGADAGRDHPLLPQLPCST